MNRQLQRIVALLLTGLMAATGCTPTQPFYYAEDGDLSHYLDRATELEYPDVETASLPDSTEALAPLTLSDPEFCEIWDLRLEEVIAIGLQNSKVIRNLGGVTPFGFADGLVNRTGQNATVFDVAINEASVETALSAFDAQLEVVGGVPGSQNSLFSITDRLNNVDDQGGANIFAQRNRVNQGGLSSEVLKRTRTGGLFSVRNRTSYDYDFFPNQFRALRSAWLTEFEARFEHPLLQGRGAMVNGISPFTVDSANVNRGSAGSGFLNGDGVLLNRINTDISLANFEASVRNFVVDVENTYWDLQCAYRQLETAKAGRDATQGTWRIVYEKWRQGVETVQAEAQAREQYFFFRSQVETALRDLYDTESRLRFLMGLAATDGRLIRPSDEPTTAKVEFNWREILSESLVRSAELRQQKWTIKQNELRMVLARNQLLPRLDVGATYRWVGQGDHLINSDRNGINFPNVGSTAFDNLTEGDFQELLVFFDFGFPIGFRAELANVRSAQLNLARSKAQLEDMELNTSHLLTTSVRSLDSNYQLAQTHFNRVLAAEEEVQSLLALYQGGKATLDLVLEGQRRRAQAQIDYYRALCEYQKSIADVHFRKGSILEYNDVFLAEGGWPEKAYWDAMGRARERDASYYLDYGWTRPGVISSGPIPQDSPEFGIEQIQPSRDTVPQLPATDGGVEEPEELPEFPEPGPITGSPANDANLAGSALPENAFDWGPLGGLRPDEPKAPSANGNLTSVLSNAADRIIQDNQPAPAVPQPNAPQPTSAVRNAAYEEPVPTTADIRVRRQQSSAANPLR